MPQMRRHSVRDPAFHWKEDRLGRRVPRRLTQRGSLRRLRGQVQTPLNSSKSLLVCWLSSAMSSHSHACGATWDVELLAVALRPKDHFAVGCRADSDIDGA